VRSHQIEDLRFEQAGASGGEEPEDRLREWPPVVERDAREHLVEELGQLRRKSRKTAVESLEVAEDRQLLERDQ
jgi:hypothetical protein